MATGLLILGIYTSNQKDVYDYKTSLYSRQLEELNSKSEKLGDEKAEYEELRQSLLDNDKEDTVQYQLVNNEIASIKKELEALKDEETDLNFLKTQSEANASACGSMSSSFSEAADKAIQNSFKFA